MTTYLCRISSLPIQEYCPMPSKIGQNIETVNAKRSTIFHKWCETGSWPDEIRQLPIQDHEEIQKWKKPGAFRVKLGDVELFLKYSDALKEVRVALDKDFNFVEVPLDVPQDKIEELYPSVVLCGHIDMAWFLPDLNLVVVNDIKSSIFVVKARTKSLQIHGYGIALAKKFGATKYITALYDACDGLHYVDDAVVEVDSWEYEEYKGRIGVALANVGNSYVKGTHCGGCWKRDICPAHLVDVGGDSQFSAILGGNPTESQVRDAMVAAKGLETLSKKVMDTCKDWVSRHGPIRSEDGTKVWRMSMRSGKQSLDTDAVKEALGVKDLKSYMKQGNEFPVFDWVNNKE